MHLNTGHHHLKAPKLGGSAQNLWRERPLENSENRVYSTAGAPKLGLWRERPHSAAMMMYL